MITLVIGDIDTAQVQEKVSQNFIQEYKKPTKNLFKKVGHKFVGWSTNNLGDAEFFDCDEILNLSFKQRNRLQRKNHLLNQLHENKEYEKNLNNAKTIRPEKQDKNNRQQEKTIKQVGKTEKN